MRTLLLFETPEEVYDAVTQDIGETDIATAISSVKSCLEKEWNGGVELFQISFRSEVSEGGKLELQGDRYGDYNGEIYFSCVKNGFLGRKIQTIIPYALRLQKSTQHWNTVYAYRMRTPVISRDTRWFKKIGP